MHNPPIVDLGRGTGGEKIVGGRSGGGELVGATGAGRDGSKAGASNGRVRKGGEGGAAGGRHGGEVAAGRRWRWWRGRRDTREGEAEVAARASCGEEDDEAVGPTLFFYVAQMRENGALPEFYSEGSNSAGLRFRNIYESSSCSSGLPYPHCHSDTHTFHLTSNTL
jgi:hypothetical protein